MRFWSQSPSPGTSPLPDFAAAISERSSRSMRLTRTRSNSSSHPDVRGPCSPFPARTSGHWVIRTCSRRGRFPVAPRNGAGRGRRPRLLAALIRYSRIENKALGIDSSNGCRVSSCGDVMYTPAPRWTLRESRQACPAVHSLQRRVPGALRRGFERRHPIASASRDRLRRHRRAHPAAPQGLPYCDAQTLP